MLLTETLLNNWSMKFACKKYSLPTKNVITLFKKNSFLIKIQKVSQKKMKIYVAVEFLKSFSNLYDFT